MGVCVCSARCDASAYCAECEGRSSGVAVGAGDGVARVVELEGRGETCSRGPGRTVPCDGDVDGDVFVFGG